MGLFFLGIYFLLKLEQLIIKKSHMCCLFSIILIQCLYDLHLGYFRMTYDLKQRKKAILEQF